MVDYPYKLDPLAEDHQKYYFKCKKCGMNFAKGFTFKAFLLHINNEPMCSYYAVRKNRKELPDFRFLAKQVSCSTWASELDSLANKAAGVIMHNNEAEDAFETFLYSELRAVLDVAFIATSNSSFTVINNEIFKSIRSSNITYEVNKVLQTAAWSIEISVMKEFNNTNALTSIIVDGWKSAVKHNILGVCLTASYYDKFTYNEPLGKKDAIGAAKQLEAIILDLKTRLKNPNKVCCIVTDEAPENRKAKRILRK